MPTLKQFADRWLKSKVHEVRPKTGQRYRELLEQYALPALGPIQLGFRPPFFARGNSAGRCPTLE